MKSIAVVILNWNGQQLLEQFLPSVIEHSQDAELYVADNASTDGSVAFIKAHFPEVKVIGNKNNYGFARGYNEALKEVEEEYYALINSDIEVTAGWLEPIIALFEKDAETAIIQPKILDYKRKTHFEYAGAAGGFLDKYGYPFCRGRILNSIEEDKGQYDDVSEIFWASGACFFIRKEIYRALHGFDEDFFAHQEEIDLCWRAFNKNYKVRFCGDSTIYHVGGATLSTTNPHKTYLNFRNSLLMVIKNVPLNKLLIVFLTRLCLDGLAGINYAAHGKFGHTWAIVKSHFKVYSVFYKFFNKRDSKQYKNYYKTRSIVYQYYINSVNTFSKKFNNSL